MCRSLRFVPRVRALSTSLSVSSSSSSSSATTRKRWIGSFEKNDSEQILALPRHYLRAMDEANFDAVTGQRTDMAFDATDGRPHHIRQFPDDERMLQKSSHSHTIVQCGWTPTGDNYRIEWEDGRISHYRRDWVQVQLRHFWASRTFGTVNDIDIIAKTPSSSPLPSILLDDRCPWSNWTEAHVRQEHSLSFRPVLFDEQTQEQALRTIYKYGILLVTETPTDDQGAGVAALASALSGGTCKSMDNSIVANYRAGRPVLTLPHGTDGPLRTLYGTVWSTTSSGQSAGASVADSAYGHGSLPLHTDLTYRRDPPGLQIFTMVQPALSAAPGGGGQSVFADGLLAAETLRIEDPTAFRWLSTLPRRYRSVDRTATGWHMEATGPIIQTKHDTGQVILIRHNDLDRLPDMVVTDAGMAQLEQAHAAWNDILARDTTRLVMALQPGDTVVLANQRCLHGRYSFFSSATVNRSVMGCYVCQDELNSRLRMLGYVID